MGNSTKLSDNYHYRKCFLKREQVPTQTVMKKTMKPPLAAVYFKSMTPKLKVLAGLEPPLKGGGSVWFQPPKEILNNGRAVLKPVKKEYLEKLTYQGIGMYSVKFFADHHREMEKLKRRKIEENDLYWKNSIEVSCQEVCDDYSRNATLKNTEAIKKAFLEFTDLYTTSVTKIQQLLFDAAYAEIVAMKEEAQIKMNKKYEKLLKQQATMLQDRYNEKLMKEKARLKAEFIREVDESRTEMSNLIHDLRVEKRVIIEKIRQLLESQNMACQVYVALKEREECAKELKLLQHEHKKEVKKLKEQLAMKDFEVRLEQEKEKKRLEFIRIWKKKICHVVKKFQMFVTFCLNAMPEHAEFFINMEKLMMLQLSEAVENPSAKSIIEYEDETFHTPVPRPHPFYLCCNKGYKPELDQDLCPKHCTSSASQMPVVIVNKRCIYAACDNFNMFTDKIQQFIQGQRGDDAEFTDDHEYKHDVPVKMTSSLELLELKLESSLLQVLKKELPSNTNISSKCFTCMPHCFCSSSDSSKISTTVGRYPYVPQKAQSWPIVPVRGIKSRNKELLHEREPKWKSYFDYVHPSRKCHCAKMAKKHLEEHMPPYMKNTSKYENIDLTGYEVCSLATLKSLVKEAHGIRTPPPPPPAVPPRTHDVSTQYSDQEVDFLCTCFTDDEVEKLFKTLKHDSKVMLKPEEFIEVTGFESSSRAPAAAVFRESPGQFATKCAFSLKGLLDESPQLEEIFKKRNCIFNDGSY